MSLVRYSVRIPTQDISGNPINFFPSNTLSTNMEAIAVYGFTHGGIQDTRWISGGFADQCNVLHWIIDNTELSTAESNYSLFVGGYAFTNEPRQHAEDIIL